MAVAAMPQRFELKYLHCFCDTRFRCKPIMGSALESSDSKQPLLLVYCDGLEGLFDESDCLS